MASEPASISQQDPANNQLLALAEVGKLTIRNGALCAALEDVTRERDHLAATLVQTQDALAAAQDELQQRTAQLGVSLKAIADLGGDPS